MTENHSPAAPTAALPTGATRLATSQAFAAAQCRVTAQLLTSLACEGLVTYALVDGELVVPAADPVVTFRAPARRRHSFGRISLDGPAYRDDGRSVREATASEVLLAVAPSIRGASADRVAAFSDELDRTVWNHAAGLADGASDTGGHRYHPAFKSRVGFDAEDHHRYAPEAAPDVRPWWVAVHRRLVQLGWCGPSSGGLLELTFGEPPPALRPDRDDLVALPVHPWQWHKRLVHRLGTAVRSGDVVELGTSPHAYRPTASIRTLRNVTDSRLPSLKLPLTITNTSTGRTLPPHTVSNAPKITAWLKTVAATDPLLADERRLVVVGEVAGAAVDGPSVPPTVPEELSCLWRESLYARRGPDEETALFATLPDPTLLATWLARYGTRMWTARLLEVTLTPLVHLLVAHGIAVEAHAQNTILLHRRGWPTGLAIQDLHDGLRFARRHLATPGRVPDLVPSPPDHLERNPNSYLEAEHADEVRDFAVDCLFFVNLAELAFVLADRFGLTERCFWGLARRVVDRHRARFPRLRDRHALFDLTAPSVRVEQLTTRRLLPETAPRLQEVANPLATAVARQPTVLPNTARTTTRSAQGR